MKSRRPTILLSVLVAVGIACLPRLLLAHEVGPEQEAPSDFHELWRTWGFEPGTVIGLGVTAWLYAAGLWRTWTSSGVGHGIRRWEAACFWGGWLALFVALVSPLHPLGQALFSAHMAQHELLMLIAAPLLVLGRPMVGFLRGMPSGVASRLGRFSNTHGWKIVWRFVSAPLVAWLVHAIVLWTWHAPALFQATLHNEWVHAAQHLSFLLSALLFWWALIHGHRGIANYGTAVLYLFTTAIHSGLLGALLTFARTVWYPDYAATTESWGLTPLEDQQIGGLIMWVPACSVYIVAGLAMFAGWLRQSEQRVARRKLASAHASLTIGSAP